MINFIDKVQYLSPNRNELVDMNTILNDQYKDIIDDLKKKARRINTNGYSATVTIKGRVSATNSQTNISFDIKCESDEVAKSIEQALGT